MSLSNETLLSIYTAVQSFIDHPERSYVLRFVNANVHLTPEDFVAKWEQDSADREEAAKKYAHHVDLIADEFKRLAPEKQQAIIAMTQGVQIDSSIGETN